MKWFMWNKEIYFVMFLIFKNSKLDNINMMSWKLQKKATLRGLEMHSSNGFYMRNVEFLEMFRFYVASRLLWSRLLEYFKNFREADQQLCVATKAQIKSWSFRWIFDRFWIFKCFLGFAIKIQSFVDSDLNNFFSHLMALTSPKTLWLQSL